MKLKDLLKITDTGYDIIDIIVFEGNGERYKTPYPKKALDKYGEREVKSSVPIRVEKDNKQIEYILKILIY